MSYEHILYVIPSTFKRNLGVSLAAALALGSATVEAQTAGPSDCLDAPSDTGATTGAWPGGRILLGFDPGYPWLTELTASIERWQNATANVIEFVGNPRQQPGEVIISVRDCMENPTTHEISGYGPGLLQCVAGNCNAFLCPGNMDHELGHIIGLGHQQERSDRDHYVRMNHPRCTASPGTAPEFRYGRDDHDYGPYNYQSVMHYAPLHDHITRWDGTSICHSIDGAGNCLDGAAGPFDSIKPSDAASVIEMYTTGSNTWSRFRRTFGQGAPTPYTTDLAPEVDEAGLTADTLIAVDASPAVETWGGDSLSSYVRLRNGRIGKKFWDTSARAWSAWEVLPAAPNGDSSDPAVTSWGNGRTDLAVRSGNEVFIMSTPNWRTWESLGAPAGGAVSAPAITSKRTDELMVVVRGADRRMHFRECTAGCSGASGTWSAWAPIGNEVFSGKPSIVSRGQFIDLVAHGLTDTIWLTEFRDFDGTFNWAQWGDQGRAMVLGNNGCDDCNSPALGSHSGTSLDIYVRGLDNLVWMLTWDVTSNSELQTAVLGGVVQTSPAVPSVLTQGRADLFVTMLEETFSNDFRPGIWHKRRTSF